MGIYIDGMVRNCYLCFSIGGFRVWVVLKTDGLDFCVHFPYILSSLMVIWF